MEDIISAHNKSILSKKEHKCSCNCRNKSECPLGNKCQTEGVIYKATVVNEADNERKFYIGLTENSFKDRFSNHKKSFVHRKYEKETELSKYVWKLKDDNKTHVIKWSIIKKVNSKPSNRFCKLCLMEKLLIIKSLDNEEMLNKRSELVSKCRHKNKTLLSNFKNDSYD
jgi:predicted GIY-YIG superfamily endonuclease